MQNDLRFSSSRTVIRRKLSSSSKVSPSTNEGSTFAIVSRSFKDFKKFQEQKLVSKNSFYSLNRDYEAFLYKLQTLLSKTFKSLPLSRCDSNWQEQRASLRFSMGRFEKTNQESFLKASLIKVMNVCNDLVEEEEFGIKSIIERIDLRGSHKTDEVLIVFVIKDNICPGVNRLSKQEEMDLKTLVFRLRDLGAIITSSYYSKEGKLTKIVGTDGLREGVADINIEVKPYTEFETNPYKGYDILRRFEQLIGRSSGEIMWNFNCGYGLSSIAAFRAGYRCFSQTKPDTYKSMQTNFDLNKKIIPNDILINKDTYITDKCDSELKIPKDMPVPSLICVGLDSPISQELLNTVICGITSSSHSRLFIYTKDLSNLEDISLKLKNYHIELKQIEAHQLLPTKDTCCYLAIYTKNFMID